MSIIANKKTDIKNLHPKRHYEIILMFRSNILFTDVNQDITSIISFITSKCFGAVMTCEYWGLRPMSYEINGDKKSHYYFLSVECDPTYISSINAKILPNENIIRHAILKSEFPADRYNTPSIMMQNLKHDIEKEMGELVWSDSFVYKI